jgi:CheY-like chemotaxis protein
MPNPGDGFTVVTAMRHSQPDALTLVISGFPDVQEAMAAILLQADEVLVKPFDVQQLVDLIRKRTQKKKRPPKPAKESVASILERDATITIQRWLARVKRTEELACVPLSDSDRTGHVSEIIKSIVIRLRDTRAIEAICQSVSCGCGPRASALSARLRCTHDRAGVPNFAGVHFRDHPTKFSGGGFQFGTAGRYADCRRSGLPIDTERRELSEGCGGGSGLNGFFADE